MVSSLHLAITNLTHLTHLTYLLLSNNSFARELKFLYVLDLIHNNLSGRIPEQISELTKRDPISRITIYMVKSLLRSKLCITCLVWHSMISKLGVVPSAPTRRRNFSDLEIRKSCLASPHLGSLLSLKP